jgi:ribonuclease Z
MNFAITILGSSSALPTSTRYPTAHLLNANERFFLIDCGEGTQMQLRKYKARFSRINHIFISHLHGDHYFGLFGLLSSFSLLGRTNPLHLFAHKELKTILDFQFKYFPLNFELCFIDIPENEPAILFENKQLTVTSFPLKHRIPSSGFVFREKQKEKNIKKEMVGYYNLSIKDIIKIKQGSDFVTSDGKLIPNQHLTMPSMVSRSYAFCSDTEYEPSVVQYIKDCDLLYHETTFASDMEHLAAQTGHSTAKQAAEIAKLASAKKLLIGHFSARYKNLSVFETEARDVFQNTYIVDEGKTYTIELNYEKY